ncbi:MAG: response regulator transcription factor [Bacteroidota bacterium]
MQIKANHQNLRMLVVEDNEEVAQGLEDYFITEGYQVTRADDGETALSLVRRTRPTFDIVLLDVMLPKKNGFEVLQDLQSTHATLPVLMLTGRGEEESVLNAFGLGAEDYVVKPFSPEELAARVQAILHRTMPPDRTPMLIYRFGHVSVNFSTHEAYFDENEVSFTALEFDILRYLIENKERIVSRKELLRDVWGISQDIVTRTIDRHIASVRKKIEPDPTQPFHIETVYGQGYRFYPEGIPAARSSQA